MGALARIKSGLRRHWWIVGLAIAAFVVVVLAPRASSDPDGLEAVAGQQGFLQSAQDAIFSIIPGYSLPGVESSELATILAGLVGVALVFALMIGLGWLLKRRRSS